MHKDRAAASSTAKSGPMCFIKRPAGGYCCLFILKTPNIRFCKIAAYICSKIFPDVLALRIIDISTIVSIMQATDTFSGALCQYSRFYIFSVKTKARKILKGESQ